jgi:hypothetical protein
MNRWSARLAELKRDCILPANVQNVQIVQKPRSVSSFEHFEQIEQRRQGVQGRRKPSWSHEYEERAAIVEFDGGVPRAWAEALARLDPTKPPNDVPPGRWLGFIDDCGRFLDQGWASTAAALGWGPLDLFGCDRERPFVHDHRGLLWVLNGGSILQMHRDRATIKTQGGAQQTYRRRPVEVGRVVLAWELAT